MTSQSFYWNKDFYENRLECKKCNIEARQNMKVIHALKLKGTDM